MTQSQIEENLAKLESAVADRASARYVLRLYVAGFTPRSATAIASVKKTCEEHLRGRYELEVVNLYDAPTLAKGEQIIAAPTLIKKLPLPLRRVIGDMADTNKLLVGLDLREKYPDQVRIQRCRCRSRLHMKRNDKPSTEKLIAENAELRARLEEAEQTLRAISEGEVDAVIVTGSRGDRVFSLSEAENLHRLMVETMNEAGLAITPDGMVIFCNNRACTILGRPREQLVGRDLGQFVCPSDADRFRQMLQSCRTAAVDSRIEFLAATGETVPMHVWASYLDRNDIPLICLVATDISRIEADQSLIIQLQDQRQQLIDSRKAALNLMQDAVDARARSEQLSAELCKSEAIYRSIGESIDYGVWICAPDGRNIYASQSFLKMVGITQEQCSDFGWGDMLHPDDAERALAAWRECVRTGGTWDYEHRFAARTANGIRAGARCAGQERKWRDHQLGRYQSRHQPDQAGRGAISGHLWPKRKCC